MKDFLRGWEGGRCLGGAVGQLAELQELTLNFAQNNLGWGPRKVAGPRGWCGLAEGTFQARSKVGGRMKAPRRESRVSWKNNSAQDVS